MRGVGSGQHETGDVAPAKKKKAVSPVNISISTGQDNWSPPSMAPMMEMPSRRKQMADNHNSLMGRLAGRRI